MVRRFLIILLPAFLLLIWFSSGCEQKPHDEKRKAFEKYYDRSLAKIYGPAAIVQFNVKINREFNCILSEAFDKSTQTSGNANSLKKEKSLEDFMSRLSTQQKQKCDFFTMVDNATAPTFNLIKSSGQLPNVSYCFTVLLHKGSSQEGEIYDSVEIGLFRKNNECIRFENMARSIGLPTTACKEWP
ncbi:hypothetical protein ACFL2O_10400 [Thermodesulfobacteriota bacterium]